MGVGRAPAVALRGRRIVVGWSWRAFSWPAPAALRRSGRARRERGLGPGRPGRRPAGRRVPGDRQPRAAPRTRCSPRPAPERRRSSVHQTAVDASGMTGMASGRPRGRAGRRHRRARAGRLSPHDHGPQDPAQAWAITWSSTSCSTMPARSSSRPRSGRAEMRRRPADGAPGREPEAALDAGFWLVIVLAGLCLVLVAVTIMGGGMRPAEPDASASPGRAGATTSLATSAVGRHRPVRAAGRAPGAAARPDRPGRPAGQPRLDAGRPRARLLRLHPLPGRLSGDHRHGRDRDARLRTGRPGRLRERRS